MPRSPSPSPPLDDPHLQRSTKRRVSYFYDPDVGGFAYPYQHPMKPHRMRMAHALIGAYGMLGQMQVVRPKRADELQLTRFHTDEYIEFLKSITAENYMEWTANKKFCQTDDCPPWDGLFDFATLTAGSSISAAHSLVTGHSDIAIAWAGGLHHAKRAEASGFCYVNDIVLGILELLRAHARVLYVDIDIHHGDGVEEAFYTTDRVMTCSFHKFGDFFPGTGTVGDVGKGRGKGYAVNVPLRDGLSDEKFVETFKSVIGRVMEWYRPGAVVLQGGADSLAGDKLGVFNLSMNGHAACAAYMRGFNVPLLMVGGGGYTVKNVSRTWTYETAVAIGCTDQISPDLPDNEYLEWFGPRYKLEVLCNNQEDYNTTEYVEGIKQKIWENMRDLPHAPSAGVSELQEGRRTWRGDDWEEEDSDMDDLDKRISQRLRDAHTKGAEDPLSDSEADSAYDSDDGPHAAARTFRARKLPRKQRYSERFTPDSPSRSDSDEEDEAERERDARPRFAPRKRPRTFFGGASGAFVDPRLAEWQREERERERVEAVLRAEREREREALRAALAEVMEEELALLGQEREKRPPLAGGKDAQAEEEDVDMDEMLEREEQERKDAEEDGEGDEDEEREVGEDGEEEDAEEEEHDRLKPMLHPAVLERLGSQEKEDAEDQDEHDEQEDEQEEAEDGEEREEDEDEKDAQMDVDVDVDDEDGDGEEGEVDEAAAPAPAVEDDVDQDGSDLSEEEEGGTVEAEREREPEEEGDHDAEQDDEAELDVGDDEGTGTVEDAEDQEGERDPEQEPDEAAELEQDGEDAEAGNREMDESRLPTPTGGSPDAQDAPESSEPSTVSLSRSPSGSPPAAGAHSGEEMEEGELDEERGRDTGTKDLRLEDLADVAGARERPDDASPVVGKSAGAAP